MNMKAVITDLEVTPRVPPRRRGAKPKPVVYLWMAEYNPIAEMATGERWNKPHRELRDRVGVKLVGAGIMFDAMKWDSHAGCSMCPCSPGWVLKNARTEDPATKELVPFVGRVDVRYAYVPAVEEEGGEPDAPVRAEPVRARAASRLNRMIGDVGRPKPQAGVH